MAVRRCIHAVIGRRLLRGNVTRDGLAFAIAPHEHLQATPLVHEQAHLSVCGAARPYTYPSHLTAKRVTRPVRHC